jgi:hypothetical protein
MWQPKSLKIVNIISFKEQTFEFRNGKAILLVGDNQDDSSQKGKRIREIFTDRSYCPCIYRIFNQGCKN